jgi:hypothetical protein
MQLTRQLPRTSSLALALLLLGAPATAQVLPCNEQAQNAQLAGVLEAQSDLQFAFAIAHNIIDPMERAEAMLEAFGEYIEALELERARYDARLAVCARLGGGAYAPDIDPQDFVALIDNPFLPYSPGAQRSYRKITAGGDVETVETEVLSITREILGVTCTVVRDIERENGVLVEETLDYFAQDEAGNVWYFGEISMNYEEGFLTDLDGSWIAGEDGAEPGIVMPAAPTIGTVYRQEFALGEAEDTGAVIALGAQVQVPYGNFNGCLVTYDFSALEPEAREHKSYASGLGLVLEVDLESGERTELISAQ